MKVSLVARGVLLILANTCLAANLLQLTGGSAPCQPTHGPIPTWSNGALTWTENNDTANPVVHLLAPDGVELPPVVVAIPDANVSRVYSASRTRDGRVAVCGVSGDKQGRRSGFLAFSSGDRQGLKIVRLPFLPYLLTEATDGSIWLQGEEVIAGKISGPGIDASRGVLRRYDASGRETGSFIPRSTLGFQDTEEGVNRPASGGARVGWYSRSAAAFFEVDARTGAFERFPGIPLGQAGFITGLALTDSGHTIVSIQDKNQAGMYRLDRMNRAWVPLAVPSDVQAADFILLYGGDGERLALRVVNHAAVLFAQMR